MLHRSCGCTLLRRGGVVATNGLGDLGEVAAARRGNDGGQRTGLLDIDLGQRARDEWKTAFGEQALEVLEECGDPIVGEASRRGAVHRHVLPCGGERLAVAYELARHVATRIFGTATLEFVDGHGVGEVEHVDLLQL
jgi:hypothetical protein